MIGETGAGRAVSAVSGAGQLTSGAATPALANVLAARSAAGKVPDPPPTPQSEALAEAGEEGTPMVEKCPYAHH
jgi:hypothetical protein